MKKFFILVIVLITAVQVAYAALPSVSGGSGLIISRTTDVLKRGAFNTSIFLNTNIYSISEDNIWPKRNTDINPSLSFNYGVIDTFEVGLLLPFVIGAGIKSSGDVLNFTETETGSGLGKMKLILKYAVFPNTTHTKPFNAGLTGYVGLPTSSNKFAGSTSVNPGIELNTAVFYGQKKQFGTYLNFGWENGDYYYEPCPAGAYIVGSDTIACPYDGVTSGSKLVGNLGADYYPVSSVGIIFEVIGSSFSDTKDEDLSAVIGAKYIPTDYLAIDGGVGIGLPPDQTKPNSDYSVTLGASYLFGSGKAASASPKSQSPVTTAKSSMPPADAPVPPAAKEAIKVMVLNGCDIENTAEPTANFLKGKGINVVKVAQIKDGKYPETSVMFPREYTKEAVDISRLLPGKQKMARLPKPRTDADVVVVAGCDQMTTKAASAAQPMITTPPPAPVPPATSVQKKELKDISINIFNGCGKSGVGEEAAKKLLLGGYNIKKVGNAEKRDYKTTEITFQNIYEKETKEIADKLKVTPSMKPVTTLPDSEITVIIGCDFTGK
ncbi:MAG TPA: LytR C-terminal domain-containing protein [bacterium]